MNREYLGYSPDLSIPQYKPYRLVFCKAHAKDFKWVCKNVYAKPKEKISPTRWYFMKGERTDECCMWCEHPEKFEKFDGIFWWMDVIRKREMAKCKHNWERHSHGMLPDGQVVVEEHCLCGKERERKLDESDSFSQIVKEHANEIKISPEEPYCLNCRHFSLESSRCSRHYSHKSVLMPPHASCSFFEKAQ